MNIAQVMQATAGATGARFTHFDQMVYKGRAGFDDDGVCHALCKVWLKTINSVQPHNFQAEVERQLDKIVAKQKKASNNKFDSPRFQNSKTVSHALLSVQGCGDQFWKKFAFAMRPSIFLGRIGGIEYGGTNGHAVATYGAEDRFRFFDPSGGILDFGDDDTALKVFLRDTLKTATTNKYDRIHLLTVREFTPKGFDDD